MVLLGGLEIVAAGYLLSELNKDKIAARERRKHSHVSSDESSGSNSSSRPHSPHHRPPRRHDRYDDHRPSRPSNTFLAPPYQPPARPSSAPPMPIYGPPQSHTWPLAAAGPPQPPPHPYQGPNRPLQSPPPNTFSPQYFRPVNNGNASNPYPVPNSFQASGPAPGPMGPNQPPPLQRPYTYHTNPGPPPPQPPIYSNASVPPGSHPNYTTTNPPPYTSRPPPPVAPASGTAHNIHAHIPPGTYIDTKTGRVQHNLYPPDHPMARSIGSDPVHAGTNTNMDLNTSSGERGMVLERDRREDDFRERRQYRQNRQRRRDRSGSGDSGTDSDSSRDLAHGKPRYSRRHRGR